MDNYRYPTENREPDRAYTPLTPSHDSEEDLYEFSNLSINDKSYKLYSFRKEGRSWANAICSESSLPETEIRKRAKRPRKASHSVDTQLEKMSPPRRNAIEDLLERTISRDPDRAAWDILAIDNDKPELTKRTGEVVAFSVILARVARNKQRTNSVSQERRRSSFISPRQEFAVPNRRASKSYHQGRSSPIRDSRDNRSGRQSQSFKNSHNALEEDPFGTTQLFSPDGKPVNASGSAAYTNAGLPPHIPLDEPVGAQMQKDKDKKGGKKSKGDKSDGVIDIEAILGGGGLGLNDDALGHDFHEVGEHDDDDDFDGIEVINEPDDKRGRKQGGRAWGSKTPKQGMSQSKSKSKSRPRRPSIHIPRDDKQRPPIQEVMPGHRRRQQPYWGSHGSATTPSIHSDHSILEAEYEDYSSSGSSGAGPIYDQDREYRAQYAHRDDRYRKEKNYHRRGPPSPQHVRYEMATSPEQHYMPQRRRSSRQERYPSEGAMQRYSYAQPQRPPLITHASAPRFTPTPTSAHPASAFPQTSLYTYESAMTPYPNEMGRPRRDSLQVQQAEMYMQSQDDQLMDREIELLQRERDLARQQADFMSQQRAAGGRSRYTYEPRLIRRSTEGGYYP